MGFDSFAGRTLDFIWSPWLLLVLVTICLGTAAIIAIVRHWGGTWVDLSAATTWVWFAIVLVIVFVILLIFHGNHATPAPVSTPAPPATTTPAMPMPAPAPVPMASASGPMLLPPVIRGGSGVSATDSILLNLGDQIEGELCCDGAGYVSPWYKLADPTGANYMATVWGRVCYRLHYSDGSVSPIIGQMDRIYLPEKKTLAFRIKTEGMETASYTVLVRKAK